MLLSAHLALVVYCAREERKYAWDCSWTSRDWYDCSSYRLFNTLKHLSSYLSKHIICNTTLTPLISSTKPGRMTFDLQNEQAEILQPGAIRLVRYDRRKSSCDASFPPEHWMYSRHSWMIIGITTSDTAATLLQDSRRIFSNFGLQPLIGTRMKEQSCATDHTKKTMQTADHSPAALSANLETVPSWFRRVRAAEVSSVRASSSLALKM